MCLPDFITSCGRAARASEQMGCNSNLLTIIIYVHYQPIHLWQALPYGKAYFTTKNSWEDCYNTYYEYMPLIAYLSD